MEILLLVYRRVGSVHCCESTSLVEAGTVVHCEATTWGTVHLRGHLVIIPHPVIVIHEPRLMLWNWCLDVV
jgi:hypothetical protein